MNIIVDVLFNSNSIPNMAGSAKTDELNIANARAISFFMDYSCRLV